MSFQSLYRSSPQELKQIIMDQWKAKQNPTYHPEGNTLKHIIVVTNRAFKNFPDNKDIQLAAYFHDLGKLATYQALSAMSSAFSGS
jgi:HD superfamily phosphodiesterase